MVQGQPELPHLDHPALRAMKHGRRLERIADAARTDTEGVADGTVHVYRSGATLVLQMFDSDAGAWRAVTLS